MNSVAKIYIVLSLLVVTGLFFSAFATQSFLTSQPEFRSIVSRGESPNTIATACQRLHLPLMARALPVFVPLTLFMALVGIAISLLAIRRRITTKGFRWSVYGVTIVTSVVFFSVQVWEPDYLADCMLGAKVA